MSSALLVQFIGYGEQLLAGCRQEMATLAVTRFGPVNASGKTSEALRVEVTTPPGLYRLRLFAPLSIQTLFLGRKPGKMPPLSVIQQWITDKGIVPRPNANGRALSIIPNAKGYSPLAFAFALAIKNNGNTVFQQGPPSKLFVEVLGQQKVSAEVKIMFGPLLVLDVQTQIHTAIAA